MNEITIRLWGPQACFTPPYAKVERLSYAVPTPSAIRNILNAIYCKPVEFYWAVKKIEVMKPIKYMSCKRNEVKKVYSGRGAINTQEDHTQRSMSMLKDVEYRVTAAIVAKIPEKEKAVYEQAIRRITKGQCFWQPYFGMRECECYYELVDPKQAGCPIPDTMDFGLMVYDTHIPYACNPGYGGIDLSLYHCRMENGIIRVPDYDSPEVFKQMKL